MNSLTQSMKELARISEAVNAPVDCPYYGCDGDCWFCLGMQELAAVICELEQAAEIERQRPNQSRAS